jgi:hypothetical protein
MTRKILLEDVMDNECKHEYFLESETRENFVDNSKERVMKEKLKDEHESFKDMVLAEYEKGNIVFMSMEGPMVAELQNFISQPAEGILYDLNRDKVTVLTMIRDKKWVNDYAVAVVITELKRQLDEQKKAV